MADTLAIYNKIVREIPPLWFDPEKLVQDANGANASTVARLIWVIARMTGVVADQVDSIFKWISPMAAEAENLDRVLRSKYDRARKNAETDAAYRTRVGADLFGRRKTREAILVQAEAILGMPPIDFIEAARDSFFLGHSFLGVNYISPVGRGQARLIINKPLQNDGETNADYIARVAAIGEELADAIQSTIPAIGILIEVRS